jgi:hypothetical protein
MKLLVTLDYLDGTSKVRGPFWPDDIDTRGLLFKLAERDLASITFVNADPIGAIKKGLHEPAKS